MMALIYVKYAILIAWLVTVEQITIAWHVDLLIKESFLDSNVLPLMVRYFKNFYTNIFFLGFYDDGINQLCPPCHPNCLTCSAGTSNNCLTCQILDQRVISGTTCICKDGKIYFFI